jgi:hypothetical protein
MRMMLKALVLVPCVVGTTMFAMETAEAVEKPKGRAELQNSKGVQGAQKGNVAPVAKKGTATPIASNATLSKGSRVKSEQARGIPVAEKGKSQAGNCQRQSRAAGQEGPRGSSVSAAQTYSFS